MSAQLGNKRAGLLQTPRGNMQIQQARRNIRFLPVLPGTQLIQPGTGLLALLIRYQTIDIKQV